MPESQTGIMPSGAAPAITCGDFGKLKPRQRKVLAALQDTLVIQEACQQAKVGSSTFYAWLDDPNFRACYDHALAAAVPQVEVAHFKAATGRDTLARIHILKNRHPAYREGPSEVKVSHTHAHVLGDAKPTQQLAGAAVALLAAMGAIGQGQGNGQDHASQAGDKADTAKPILDAQVTDVTGTG